MTEVVEVLVSYPSVIELTAIVGKESLSGLEQGHIQVVTLNRPEARNALTHSAYAGLEKAIRESSARCIIVTGTDPAFCSGDDVRQVMAPAGRANPAERLAANPLITPAAEALLTTNIPIIAAVNGAAVGWGMELALMADIGIISEKARFGELFVLRGLVTDSSNVGLDNQGVADTHSGYSRLGYSDTSRGSQRPGRSEVPKEARAPASHQRRAMNSDHGPELLLEPQRTVRTAIDQYGF